MRFSGNYFRLTQCRRAPTLTLARASPQVKIMVAFKEEFPYLRTTSGQLFEFNRDWLHAAITRAADEAGYPGWWLTEHVTESITFYLHLRNDESVVAFNQLSQTVRDVLAAIGYKEIGPHFTPAPPIARDLIVPCADETLSAMTIFEKIIARQIPAKIIWEDDHAIAFHDVDPQAPVHVLIVPKKAVVRLADATDEDASLLGKLLL